MKPIRMKSCRVLILLLFALAVSGCGSLGGSVPGEQKVYIGDISNLPQVLLPGATMQDARSVAMASARTRGWDILVADANRLVLERPLPAELPQAQALRSALAPPRMQVQTDIVERRDGAIVALQAFALTNPGTAEEQRIDYTSEYENQLLVSLSSLSSSWIAAQDKLRSRVPRLAEREAQEAEATETAVADASGDAAETVAPAGGAAAAASTPSAAAATNTSATAAAGPAAGASSAQIAHAAVTAAQAETRPAPQVAPRAVPPQPVPGASPPAVQTAGAGNPAPPTTSASVRAAPVTSSGPGTVPAVGASPNPAPAVETAVPSFAAPAPIAPTAPADSGGSNDMLALSQGTRTGLWAYYAEDFARLRGCAVGERGATLVREADGFEVHEVECVRTANLLVRCRGGVCEPLR